MIRAALHSKSPRGQRWPWLHKLGRGSLSLAPSSPPSSLQQHPWQHLLRQHLLRPSPSAFLGMLAIPQHLLAQCLGLPGLPLGCQDWILGRQEWILAGQDWILPGLPLGCQDWILGRQDWILAVWRPWWVVARWLVGRSAALVGGGLWAGRPARIGSSRARTGS